MKALLRFTVDHFLLLPIGGLLALVWANLAAESYFTVAHGLSFWVNDVAMAFFFAIIAQEVIEEVMPGGALHTWRRWLLPMLAAAGSIAGAALVYLAYVNWKYELVLRDGWPVATAIDVAVVYVLVRSLFKRHPAVPFVLIVAIAANVVGLAVVASRQHLVNADAGGLSMMFVALLLAVAMRVVAVKSFWPYLLVCGPLFWWSMYALGLNPALALVPIVPFLQHTRRSLVLFEDRPHSGHDSPAHFEHVFMNPVHGVLFLFGVVNAGVLLNGYGTGTWALVAAALLGKPAGLLAATALGLAVGLHLPRGLHWRDLGVVALATGGGFAFALFFATAVYPLGPVLAELKLGAILSGIGVPITIAAAWLWKVGRFKHATVVLAILVLASPAIAAESSRSPFDILVRVNGPVRVAGNETTQSVVVIKDNAVIDGTVDGVVLVAGGRADISGTVAGDVVVFGDVYLAPGARITRNVTVYGGALSRADGARVDGEIHLEQAPAFRGPGAAFVFLSIATFVLGGSLLLTLIAWRPLSNSAQLVLAHPFNVFAIGTLVALSVPSAAIAVLPTGIGLLLGLAVLTCVIPAAIFCGFAVAAIAIGDWIARREPHFVPDQAATRVLAEVTLGGVVALVLLLIPVVGIVLLLTASTMGVGALVTRAWEAWPHTATVVA